jgi:nucleotide-binding universal stress UspA family protein
LDIKDQLDISESALPVGRTADVFVALRTNGGPSEPKDLIEMCCSTADAISFWLLRTGPASLRWKTSWWHGTAAASRRARWPRRCPISLWRRRWGVLVVEGERRRKTDPMMANDAVRHLRHHGIDAVKYRAVGEEDDTADLMAEQCRSFGANLLVMGSYGHSAQHDLLPGSTTSRMLRISPVPLLIAH